MLKKGGGFMGLFGFFNKGKKAKLLELQKIVIENSPDYLVLSESQLMNEARSQAKNDLRIMNDCVKLLSSTLKPDVFFSRLDLLEKRSKHLVGLEPYISFSGALPSEAYKEFLSDKNLCVRQFIARYSASISDIAANMKTDKGKKNQYQKFYDNLEPYFSIMSNDNIEYVNLLYASLAENC
jgi:hypothetical protein